MKAPPPPGGGGRAEASAPRPRPASARMHRSLRLCKGQSLCNKTIIIPQIEYVMLQPFDLAPLSDSAAQAHVPGDNVLQNAL